MPASPTPATFGVTSMTAPLRRVLVRRPATSGDWQSAGWRVPDAVALVRQHEELCALLESLGARVEVAAALDGLVDSVYMHDPLLVTARGGIPLRMRKPVRAQEPAHAREELERLGVPVLGELPEGAYADGGDRFWIDDGLMAIGLSYRTNRAGAAAVAALAAREGVAVEAYDMAHDRGPDHVLHLQSFISAITEQLCVIYEPLAPVRLLEDLGARGRKWIAIDRDSYNAMGCNILAVRPGVVVMAEGAPAVRGELERRGVEVHTYDGSELSLKGDGGPTCLTAPLLRG
ncbi:MAG: dimethylarginine dimethylaminohydrolase family protein [Solirubrobacteraceae bacterium]